MKMHCWTELAVLNAAVTLEFTDSPPFMHKLEIHAGTAVHTQKGTHAGRKYGHEPSSDDQ
jgi:hypothetical protein